MNAQKTADIIIVGGGIIGLATAYYLAQRKMGNILVLERTHLGMGSTGTSVASIEPLAMFPSMATLQQNSITVFKNFEDHIGGDCDFMPLPLAMFVGEQDLLPMRHALKMAQAAGSDVFEIGLDDFLQREPNTNLDGVAAIYGSYDSGFADPTGTLNAFADAARALGVTIQQQTPVDKLLIDGERVTGVETPHGAIHAPLVLLATGLWLDPLLNQVGLQSGVSFFRHYVVPLEAPPDAPKHMVLDAAFDFYSRPEKSGGLYLIGTGLHDHKNFDDLHNPAIEVPHVTQEMCFAVWEKVVERFPAMENANLRKGAYTGVADITPDNQPLLGALPIEGLYLAAGMNGIGFKMAPGVGQAMAGLLAGDEDAQQLLAPLRPTRIAENDLLIPEHKFSMIA